MLPISSPFLFFSPSSFLLLFPSPPFSPISYGRVFPSTKSQREAARPGKMLEAEPITFLHRQHCSNIVNQSRSSLSNNVNGLRTNQLARCWCRRIMNEFVQFYLWAAQFLHYRDICAPRVININAQPPGDRFTAVLSATRLGSSATPAPIVLPRSCRPLGSGPARDPSAIAASGME